MAVIPNLVIQQLASGAVVPGTLPLINTVAPNLRTDVIQQVRGRTWSYKLIDSASGGLFDSPVKLANLYNQQLARESAKTFRDRAKLDKINSPDRVGYSVRRVMFSGTGTTAVVGTIVNPFQVTASVADEALVVSPAPNGVVKEFTAPLATGNVMYETFRVQASGGKTVTGEAMTPAPAFNGAATVFTFPALAVIPVIAGSLAIATAAGAGSEDFTDNGDGTLTGDGGGTGTINYTTGVVGLTYSSAPAGGLAVTGDYSHSVRFDVTLRDRGNEKLAFVDANGSWLDAGTIDYKISPETGVGSVRMRFQTAPPTGSAFVAAYDRGTAVGDTIFFDTALVSGIDPTSFNVGIPITGSNEVIVPPYWSVKFVSVGNLSTIGSLGVMYGVGYGQRGGQESPGFGLQH